MELPDLYGFSNHHLVGKGVCIHCATPLPGTKFEYPRCAACNASYRALYHARIEAGLCPRCPEPLANGYKHCERHLQRLPRANRIPTVKPVVRWAFLKFHDEYERVVKEYDRLIADLWGEAGHAEDTLLLEFLGEAEANKADAVARVFTESGWTLKDYTAAASTTMVIGDGRVVQKAFGVLVRQLSPPVDPRLRPT